MLASTSTSEVFGFHQSMAEVVADSPGIGQLAWQAALGRDLPLLVTLTGLITTITLIASALATVLNEAIQTSAA